jgi:hypothetical protein
MTRQRLAYTTEIAQRILGELRRGRSLRAVCGDTGMPPHSTVRQWVSDDREGFGRRYRQVRRITEPGRPTVYTADIAERRFDELGKGRPLAIVCRDPGMPSEGTVRQWVKDNREGFAADYYLARALGLDAMAGEILKIADDPCADWILRHHKDGSTELVIDRQYIRRRELRIKARRWLMSKALPKDGEGWQGLMLRSARNKTPAEVPQQTEARNPASEKS